MHPASADRRILRASDADRDAVVARLRHHGAVGRLRLDELTGRIEAALDATTLGQLDDLLVDLPNDGPWPAPEATSGPPDTFHAWRSPAVTARAAQLLVINLLCIGLWAAAGGRGLFPAWVLLISFAVLARRTSRAAARAERDRRRAERTRTPPPFLDH